MNGLRPGIIVIDEIRSWPDEGRHVDADQANRILNAGAETAMATDDFFKVMGNRREDGALTTEDIAVVGQYCQARDGFDSAIRTRGAV